MTVDEMIGRLTEIKGTHGGQTRVGCWPNDGQMFHEGFVRSTEAQLQKVELRRGKDVVTETVVWIEC